jgi:SpoVK/Ycf46/Vps4 family AAA+-type ATPase
VFVVATANDVSKLPPELLRKGRFDEIFFVDLPSPAVRAEILTLHARKRGLSLNEGDANALAQLANDFSGAELEQAVIAAVYTAHAAREPLSARHLQHEIGATRPLAVVMEEKVTALREWAKERTVPAE